jgi:hypothetical protein
MENTSAREIEVALNLLKSTRERQRRCYENNKEERKAKRRAYYWKKKAETEAEKKEAEVGSTV